MAYSEKKYQLHIPNGQTFTIDQSSGYYTFIWYSKLEDLQPLARLNPSDIVLLDAKETTLEEACKSFGRTVMARKIGLIQRVGSVDELLDKAFVNDEDIYKKELESVKKMQSNYFHFM